MINFLKTKFAPILISNLLFLSSLLLINNLFAEKEIKERAGVAGNNINVREKPEINSKVIAQLSLGYDVTVLNKKKSKVTFDGKDGYWVFVDTGLCQENCKTTKKGWVFDYYLAYDNKFIKVTNWKYKSFSMCAGDYCPSYEFTN